MGCSGNHVKQKFDDVRVWNVAKTQVELQAAMNMELVGNEAGLIDIGDLMRELRRQ